jgi:HAD superfamily hydrolase (TIGR01549 family)
MNIDKYNTIILDCDGVIFDTNLLKIKAFEDTLLYLNFSEDKVDKFINYFQNNFGISRYKLINYFIIEILSQKFDNILYEKILELYSKKSFNLYLKADLTKYLIKFLEQYKNKNLFIASGGNEEELNEIFKLRKIDKYFKAIYGSPKSKSEIVKNIVKEYKNSLMIGDAKSDMLAANKNKIDFIFMSEYSTSQEMKNIKNLKTIKNLGDLI